MALRPVPGGAWIPAHKKPGKPLAMIRTLLATTLLGVVALTPSPAAAQPAACSHRGALDDAYCDENRDLVADAPTDPARLRNPSTLVFAYTPVEDPALYASQFRPLLEHLTQCTGKRVVYFQVTSNAAQVEAMRSGRLHIAGFSTGPTAFAVNLAGAVPFLSDTGLDLPPVTGLVVFKRVVGTPDPALLDYYRQLYEATGRDFSSSGDASVEPVLYDSVQLADLPDAIDVGAETVDGALWIALLAAPKPSAADLTNARAELAGRTLGIPVQHVSYRGSAPAQIDMLAGQLELVSDNPSSHSGPMQAGRIRCLAVAAPKRMPAFPDAPTWAEQGYPQMVASAWYGFSGPAGLPPPLTQRLNASLAAWLATPPAQ
eukprot:gene43401-53059_t